MSKASVGNSIVVSYTPGDFDSWKYAANQICEAKHGISLDDLPDICYADLFESRTTAAGAVRAAIAYAKGEGY